MHNDCDYLVYEAKDGWRWKVIHQNTNILYGSSEAYTAKATAIESLKHAAERMSLGKCTIKPVEGHVDESYGESAIAFEIVEV